MVRRALLRGLKPPAPSEKTWAKADSFAALRNDKQRTGNGKSNGQYGDSGFVRRTVCVWLCSEGRHLIHARGQRFILVFPS